MIRIILYVILAGFLSGCVSNVLFYEQANSLSASDDVIKVYVDGYGDVYGEADIGFFYDAKRSRWLRCAYHKDTCSTVGSRLVPSLDEPQGWRDSQNERWNHIADRILDMLESDGPKTNRPIIFLIHGFRVPDATLEYKVAQKRIETFLDKSVEPVYVEIHWDGRQSGMMGAIKAWKEAQFSGPQVGLRLRYLLNQLDMRHRKRYDRPPLIRILTHSSGAIVAGSLIGDAGGALPCFNQALATPCSSVYKDFYTMRAEQFESDRRGKAYGVPQIPDLRIAMMAAATPSSTFRSSNGSPLAGKGILTPLAETTLIIGHNKDDIALNKVIGRADLFGDSSLGKTLKAYCLIDKEFGQEMQLFSIDMNRRGDWNVRNKHDFTAYLQDIGSEKMLTILLGVKRFGIAYESDVTCTS